MAGLEISLRLFHFDYSNLIFLKRKTKGVNTLTSNKLNFDSHQQLCGMD